MSLPKESDRRKAVRGNDVGDLSTNGQGQASTSPMPMALPDVVGLSLGEAALVYAETGWYVLPVKPGSKSPGSVVGANWHEKSSRDPDQIRVWWSDNPDYGIAVHCGRSGAGAFDLDINELEQIARDGRPDIAEALQSAGAIQATRREGDRGHYIFLMPEGVQFGNSAGAFMHWGQFRGKNGVIIVAPTTHPDAESKGGHYHWTKVGAVGPMPDVLRECLSRAAEIADPLTDDEFDAFLDTHPGEGCGRDGCRNRVNGPVELFNSQIAQGGAVSRHDEMVKATPWAFSEAMAGCYSAREAFETLHSAFVAEFDPETERARVAQLGDEFMRIAKWAAAQADPERAHRNDVGPTDAELEAFWTARPELEYLRTFARARCVGPWSTLGAVLARVISTIPPDVVLPPTIGSEASLNFFVALVARSGFGKNTSEAAAEDFVASDTYVFVATPGSGEGILKQYAYVKKQKGQEPEQVNLRSAVMFTVGEVDTFAALAGRSGSTLMPELRKAWMGERLGFGWATAEKAVVVMPHRYRMTMVVSVQPGRGGALLKDGDGGTPQRFIWLPTTDPDAPDEPPEQPEPLCLPAWSNPSDKAGTVDDKDGLKVKFAPPVDDYRLQIPPDKSQFHVLGLPPSVVEVIQQEQRAKLRGEIPEAQALDAHATLARLKVAVGLMWMNGRTDKVTEEDWDLAGVVMAVSTATRMDVQLALSTNQRRTDQARGRSDAVREIAKADALDAVVEAKIARVAERIREKLRAKNGQARAQLKRKFGPDKKHVDPALERLIAVGDVKLEPIEYKGNSGHIVWLRDGR